MTKLPLDNLEIKEIQDPPYKNTTKLQNQLAAFLAAEGNATPQKIADILFRISEKAAIKNIESSPQNTEYQDTLSKVKESVPGEFFLKVQKRIDQLIKSSESSGPKLDPEFRA